MSTSHPGTLSDGVVPLSAQFHQAFDSESPAPLMQVGELIAAHGADVVAKTLVEHVSFNAGTPGFQPQEAAAALLECIAAGANAEKIRSALQGNIDADYFQVEAQETLQLLANEVCRWMRDHHQTPGLDDQRLG